MSLLITPRFRLFVFYGELWETEKSGLKEGSECEGELKMTDDSGELKELQRGCGTGRRGASIINQTPPASTSPPLFLWLIFYFFSSFSAPITSSLLSSPLLTVWFVCMSTEVLCMLRLYFEKLHRFPLWRWSNLQHKTSHFGRCLHISAWAAVLGPRRTETQGAWDGFASHNMTWKEHQHLI